MGIGKVPPFALYLVRFRCGAWRVRMTVEKAVECARHDGATCCALATKREPHRASITEYRLVEGSAFELPERKSAARGWRVIDGGKGKTR